MPCSAISPGIADSIAHCVLRLKPGERVLDLNRHRLDVARTGANVTGADISSELLAAAAQRANAERLDIRYDQADAESFPPSTDCGGGSNGCQSSVYGCRLLTCSP